MIGPDSWLQNDSLWFIDKIVK